MERFAHYFLLKSQNEKAPQQQARSFLLRGRNHMVYAQRTNISVSLASPGRRTTTRAV